MIFDLPPAERRATSLVPAATRMLGRRWSVLLLPACAYSLFLLRTLVLATAVGEGGGRATRELHGPALRTMLPFALGHVQIVPSVGLFVLLLLLEGAILWRARLEAEEIGEPRGSFLSDPRTLFWAWLLCTLAYLVGTLSGVVLGRERPVWMALGLTLPGAALTQALFTAQVMRFWATPSYDDMPSWSLATREIARAIPALVTWEFLWAVGLAGVSIAQARVHGGESARLVRIGALAVFAMRGAACLVPLALVVRRGSITDAMSAVVRVWRTAPLATGGAACALAAAFGVYGIAGGSLSSFVLGPGVPPPVIRAVLGYGSLVLHLIAGYVVFHLFWRKLGLSAA